MRDADYQLGWHWGHETEELLDGGVGGQTLVFICLRAPYVERVTSAPQAGLWRMNGAWGRAGGASH